MKILAPAFILLIMNSGAFAQANNHAEEQAVRKIIDEFFLALESQDTVLYKKILFTEGQVWWVQEDGDSIKYNMRYLKDDINRFSPDRIVQETALDYHIKVHKQLAMAWVPYTLSISGTFSHRGVDAFTLIKTLDGWKITTAAFTIEP